MGIAVAGIMTVSSTLIGDYYIGEKRSKFIGLQGAFMGIGGVVFISLSGLLADIDWTFPFLLYLISIIAVIIGSIVLYEPKFEYQKKIYLNNQSKKTNAKQVYLFVFIGIVFFYITPVQLPFLLNHFDEMSNSKIGFAIATMNLTSAIIAIFYKKIKRIFSFNSISIMVFIFMSIGYFIIAFSSCYEIILLANAITGIGVGLLMPFGNLCIMELAEEHQRAQMIGYVTTAIFLGQFLSPILLQYFVHNYGVANIFLIASITMLLFAFILYYNKNKLSFS